MLQVLFPLILLACPIAMFFMMRRHPGHSAPNEPGAPPETDARIDELEREVARLRTGPDDPAAETAATLPLPPSSRAVPSLLKPGGTDSRV